MRTFQRDPMVTIDGLEPAEHAAPAYNMCAGPPGGWSTRGACPWPPGRHCIEDTHRCTACQRFSTWSSSRRLARRCGCGSDSVDICIRHSATSWYQHSGTTRMAVIGHCARRLPLRAAGSTFGWPRRSVQPLRSEVYVGISNTRLLHTHSPCTRAVCTC